MNTRPVPFVLKNTVVILLVMLSSVW